MDSNGLFSFMVILKEAFQLLPRNRKLMVVGAIFSVLLSEITFPIQGLAQGMESAATFLVPDPSSFFPSDPFRLQDQLDHMKQILVILYAVEIAFALVFLVLSFITTMATVLVAAVSRDGNTLSTKDLCSQIAGTWAKPFLTSIYTAIHALGLLAIPGLLAVPAFIYPNIFTILIAVLFAIVIFLFYLYLLVIWALALVVSVFQVGFYGMVAMGNASELVKGGQRLKSYMLNLSFLLLSWIMYVIFRVISLVIGCSSVIIYWCFLVGFSYLVKILQVVACTVVYFHGKKQHRQMIEIDIGFVNCELLRAT